MEQFKTKAFLEEQIRIKRFQIRAVEEKQTLSFIGERQAEIMIMKLEEQLEELKATFSSI